MSTALKTLQPVLRSSEQNKIASSRMSGFSDSDEERSGVLFTDIQFSYYRSTAFSSGSLQCEFTEPMISFVFFAAGSGSLMIPNEVNGGVSFKERQHSIFFVSAKELFINTNPGKKAEVFVINLSRSYFSRLLPAQHSLQSLLRAEPRSYQLKQATAGNRMTPRMVALLYSMLQSEHQQEYNHLFFQARVMELLVLQLEQMEKDQGPANMISVEDKQRMLRAKDLIESNLSSPCSIIDLAQLVGTNDCYLKKHFKQEFGTTVYGYLHKKRMEKAKTLLLEGKKKMADIARSVGYKHASHFSTAFKKHFGYQPNKIRVMIVAFFFESDLLVAML
ncbi:MAG: helix-turn-helix transcriptional regulator [Chitinophagaceae bacterium]|nr:helix-turn-helix transcriptional regulator [Chitinophagaceae bacterium]